jgi:hypothetical protein
VAWGKQESVFKRVQKPSENDNHKYIPCMSHLVPQKVMSIIDTDSLAQPIFTMQAHRQLIHQPLVKRGQDALL